MAEHGEVPTFPDFKALELEDMETIKAFFEEFQPETSELNFCNLFIWRGHFQTSWCVKERHLLFSCLCDGEPRVLPPVGPGPRKAVVKGLLEHLAKESWGSSPRIIRADTGLAAELEQGEEFRVRPTREHFDYLFLRERLVDLEGKDFAKKRTIINKFRREHEYRYLPMTEEHLDDCLGLAEEWCGVRSCQEDLSLTGELQAVNEALGNFSELGLTGAVIEVEGQLEAFSLGEPLNRETVVIHVEKANYGIPGLYAVMNQEFAREAWGGMKYINREQDLGEPGLRQAKMSYRPHRMVEKFEVWLRG